MPRPKRVNCRVCGRHIDECGPLSARGKCERCGLDRVAANMDAMIGRRGDFYDRWAQRTTAGLLRHLRGSDGADD